MSGDDVTTDEWLAVVLGFFVGLVVAVKLVALVIVVGAKVVMGWVMDHM